MSRFVKCDRCGREIPDYEEKKAYIKGGVGSLSDEKESGLSRLGQTGTPKTSDGEEVSVLSWEMDLCIDCFETFCRRHNLPKKWGDHNEG